MYISAVRLKRLDDKLKRLNSLRPLPSSAVGKLKEHFEVEMTYNSNAIDRKRYYRVLQAADRNNYKPLVEFVAKAVERSLDIYLSVLIPSAKNKEIPITLVHAAKISPYSAKYLNLLANKGLLEAHKEGRNWVTTEQAIQRYIAARQRKRKL